MNKHKLIHFKCRDSYSIDSLLFIARLLLLYLSLSALCALSFVLFRRMTNFYNGFILKLISTKLNKIKREKSSEPIEPDKNWLFLPVHVSKQFLPFANRWFYSHNSLIEIRMP